MTKKEQQKQAIIATLNANKGKKFSARNVTLEGVVSIDTTRAALKELVADGTIQEFKEGKGAFLYFVPEEEKVPTVGKGWKMRAIRARLITAQGPVARKELMDMTGSTDRNVHIMISILSNPSRVDNPLAVQYIKAERAYLAS